MLKFHILKIYLFLNFQISLLPTCSSYGHTNFFVKRFEACDPNGNYPLNYSITIKNVDGKQYADGDLILTVEVGSNIHSNCTLEMLTLNAYRHLFSFVEKDLCVSTHKYLGEFAYELERSAQLIPGRCPLPKGVHHIHNVPLNFDRISLQTFPFGKLRFTERAYDKQNRLITCLIIEVDNHE